MSSIIMCLVALAASNFGYQAFKDVPFWADAVHATWSQAVALFIYYFIWVKE